MARQQGKDNNDFRQFVFDRDNNTCQECDFESPSGKFLCVHHIDPIKDGGEEIDVDNGITLCEDCHKKVTKNEDEYKEKFKEIVNSKKEKVKFKINVSDLEAWVSKRKDEYINQQFKGIRLNNTQANLLNAIVEKEYIMEKLKELRRDDFLNKLYADRLEKEEKSYLEMLKKLGINTDYSSNDDKDLNNIASIVKKFETEKEEYEKKMPELKKEEENGIIELEKRMDEYLLG